MSKLRKNKEKKKYSTVSVIIILTIVISILSMIGSILGLQAYKTSINNNALESSLVTINNIISIDGLKYLIENVVNNFKNFQPLILLIISLIGISICEKSGYFKALFNPLKKVKIEFVVLITFLTGIISTVIGDYSYIFLIPLSGIIYKYSGKNPIIGILVIYLGITIGYGTGIIFNYNDHLIGVLTQTSATLDVDKNFKYSLFSNLYIMIITTIIMTIVGTKVINHFLVNKLPKKINVEEEELEISKKAKIITNIFGLILITLIIYMILPLKLPMAGILLDNDSTRYIEKVFGTNSPFANGLVFLISFVLILCGWLYGKLSKNIKDNHDFGLGLSSNFENLGFLFVLMFFLSQMIAVLDWTNIGVVIVAKLTEILGNFQFSGLLLIIIFFVFVVIMGFFVPSTITKWELMSPTIIPLFMRSNITPSFTQFIFKIADGLGKVCTPFFSYFIIMLAFLEKYKTDKDVKFGIFDIIKLIMPTFVLLLLLWILIICIWYVIGLPIGIGTYTTL